MAAALAKLSVGRPGLGAAHASYITRMSALDPDHKKGHDRDSGEVLEPLVMVEGEPSPEPERVLASTIDQDMTERELPELGPLDSPSDRNADPVWTWNVPNYITGDTYGLHPHPAKKSPKDIQTHQRMLADKMAGRSGKGEEKLALKEKVENVRCYFGSNEELEKDRGGRTHYRMVLSFDVPATNSQIRELTNEFLEQTFPKAMAFAAIHRDTDHPHVHVYIHSRQIDGKRINLKSQDYRTIDEKWSKLYSQFAGDRGIHAEHLRKKEETRAWKRAAAIAYQRGEKIPPKPERDNDRRERLAEQRLSGQRSAATERGELTGPRPAAEPVMRPRSERETGRMIAMEHLARERLAHLIRSDSPHNEIEQAARTAQGIGDALDKTIAARERISKSKLPAAAYTIEEGRQLAEYHQSRDAGDGRATAGRLAAQETIAGAELLNAQRKAEAFESRRHLWKFEIEGQDNKLSLRDIERAIGQKQADRVQVFTFIRPSRRDAIDSQLNYLGDLKKEIQEKLSGRAERLVRTVKTAELRHQTTTRELEARIGRNVVRADKPRPSYTQTELERLFNIANSNRDSGLLWHVHHLTVARAPASREWAGVMVGRALIARLEMLKAYDRQEAAHKYQASRQVPVRDAQGQDHAKSLRQVEPRTVAEAVIRYVIDKPERKQERQAVRAAVVDQINLAEREFGRANDYLAVRLRMADDYCKAAGLRPTEVAPILNEDQIRRMKERAGRHARFSSQRREFERAIPLAERALRERAAERSAVVMEMLAARRPTSGRGNRTQTQQETSIQRLQKPVGIEARAREGEGERRGQLFQMDRNDPRQQAGIARGEQMTRAVDYSRTMRDQPDKSITRQIAVMREESRQALLIIDEYRERTGRDPAPILTAEQRENLRSNQDVLDQQARKELHQGLDRAVIHLESGTDTPLDYAMPVQIQEHARSHQQEQDRDRGDSFRGR